MNEPLRWHTEVRGRTEAELADKIAVADQNALNQGWQRADKEPPRQDGDEQVVHLVYERLPKGAIPEWIWVVVVVAAVVVYLWQSGYRG